MTIRERIIKLAWTVKQAQANVERGSYFSSNYDTIDSHERSPMGGPYGGSPANPSKPDQTKPDTRLDRTMSYRRDVSLSIVSRDGNQESTGGYGGVHFGDIVNVAPSGEGVVTLF